MAKKIGTRHTIARVRNPDYSSQRDFMRNQLGFSMIVNPELEAASEIYRVLSFPSAVKVDTFSRGKVELAEFFVEDQSHLKGTKNRAPSADDGTDSQSVPVSTRPAMQSVHPPPEAPAPSSVPVQSQRAAAVRRTILPDIFSDIPDPAPRISSGIWLPPHSFPAAAGFSARASAPQ